jgi:predicted nuclease of predicted toxin-antitoxin system
MKLLVDMNLSPRWVNLLIDSGWQAIRFRTRFGSCRHAARVSVIDELRGAAR